MNRVNFKVLLFQFYEIFNYNMRKIYVIGGESWKLAFDVLSTWWKSVAGVMPYEFEHSTANVYCKKNLTSKSS